VSRGLDEISAIRHPLLLEFKRLLDEFNNWSQPERYYDIIAGDWLEHFAHLTYAAMVELSTTDLTAPSITRPIPVTADIRAYDHLLTQDSGLYEHLKEAVAYFLAGGAATDWRFSADSARIVTGGSRRLTEKVLRAFATKTPDVLLVDPYFKCSKVEYVGALWKWRNWAALDRLNYPISFLVSLDHRWRLKKACAAFPASDFLEVLRTLLPLHLPVALLEGFMSYRKEVLDIPVNRPKILYSANALHGHLTFKLLAAEWCQAGTQLVYHQHGGSIGIDKVHAFEQFESRVADRYYTWGWRVEGNPKVRPLCPAQLYSPKTRKKYLLLSCNDLPTQLYRIQFQPMDARVEILRQETCVFLSVMSKSRDLLIRPYVKDYSGNFVNMMRKAAPNAEFDDRSAKSFVRFAQSRLVVHNYLGTGYLETLALNVPTVCFYDPKAYAFRAEAQPFMDDLERVGILHRSGIEAARFVVGLASDPLVWWLKPQVQQARHSFIRNYANFSTDWKREWEMEFLHAIDDAH